MLCCNHVAYIAHVLTHSFHATPPTPHTHRPRRRTCPLSMCARSSGTTATCPAASSATTSACTWAPSSLCHTLSTSCWRTCPCPGSRWVSKERQSACAITLQGHCKDLSKADVAMCVGAGGWDHGHDCCKEGLDASMERACGPEHHPRAS